MDAGPPDPEGTAVEIASLKQEAQLMIGLIESVTSKSGALTLVSDARERLVGAMKLARTAEQRIDIGAHLGALSILADRIKVTADDWPPPSERSCTPVHIKAVKNWTAAVAEAGTVAPPSPETAPDPFVDQGAAPKGRASNYVLPFPVDRTSHALIQAREPSVATLSRRVTPYGVDTTHPHKEASHAGSRHYAPKVKGAAANESFRHQRAGPSAIPSTRIRQLAEPVSTRKRSTQEKIILLKASVVNGFKCPPWDGVVSSVDFAHDGENFFKDVRELSLSTNQLEFFTEWARAAHALPPPSVRLEAGCKQGPVMLTAQPIDLVQDAASDCSVVASLCAAVARSDKGHADILKDKLYPSDARLGGPIMSQNGKYIARLNFNGCWRKIVIDDRLPLSDSHRVLHVIDRNEPALLWPVLLEKAYLKIRGGYDFPGSHSCNDLWTLTGWIPEQIRLQETDTVPDKLWNRLFAGFEFGDVLVTLGTGKLTARQEKELNLEGQHSYVVLDMQKTAEGRFLRVKNPWVEGRGWRGPRPVAETSPESSTSGRQHQSPYSLIFTISLEQMIQRFENLYLNWNPGLFACRQDIHFTWHIKDESAKAIIAQPQFSFVAQDSGQVWFLLSRHFRDSAGTRDGSDAFNDGSVRPEVEMTPNGEAAKGYMGLFVCDGKGKQLYIKESYLECSDYVTSPQCLLRWEADAGLDYTVVVDQDELPASLYSFTLTAFSGTNMQLEPAVQKYPLQKTIAGAWTKQTAGGGTGSNKYFENPQYTVEVRERGGLAMLLTSENSKTPLHVKLTLGHGKRMYQLRSRDVLVDSGDHRVGSAFAEAEDVQPGVYTIICSLFESGSTADFTLRVDSTSAIVLKEIPRDGAGLVLMKLAPACFESGSRRIAAPLVPHRLASYTVVARLTRAMKPRSSAQTPAVRSPFRFSVELGRGPERKFVIASEQGAYSDTAILRSEAVYLDPSLYISSDLWLVLDRLSSPSDAVQEWYDIDIFTDVPHACSVGVWREWSD